ncbi:MAG: glycosyltransferase family 4 protein [Actinomycetota bacterium]|nr:glycosyltransferase family 4 protein [Actinomycetota bacterium]
MHVLFCNWRDTKNPEGGGSERYVESMARGLVDRGHHVTIFCAAHGRAPRDQVVDGVRFIRRGSKLDVYLRAFLGILFRRFGTIDLVVDVQNGLPFFTRVVTRKPVIVLVHHVHREQWPVVYPGLMGRVGWWIESQLAPRLYRHCRYVAVSTATRDELGELGVERERVTIVHNGNDPAPAVQGGRATTAHICVVGRLVPHKQIEHAIDALAQLRDEFPDLILDVVGAGWWDEELREYATLHGVAQRVNFHGFVDEQEKHEIYARSWLMALPSLKEGWGIVIGEAGTHSTPTVAYRSAGGTKESIDDGVSGVLVDSREEFVSTIARLLRNDEERQRLGDGALQMSHTFTWANSQKEFAYVLEPKP